MGKVAINPLEVLLWNGRHSGRDIINIYSKFSPMMQLGANTKMLNFGLWKNSVTLPEAQKEMSQYISDFGQFESAENVLDVGSGYCIPAGIWKSMFCNLDVVCMDLNFFELKNGKNPELAQINCSSTTIPFANGCFDRVIALESAQHFVPLEKFFLESRRVLRDSGKLVIAIPIIKESSIFKLGILGITWLSKKYTRGRINKAISKAGLVVKREESVGGLVYEPFTRYYVQNRDMFRERLVSAYSENIERLVFKSMQKMQQLSSNGTIDYLLLNLEKS